MSSPNERNDCTSEWENLETIRNVDDCDGSSMSQLIKNIHSADLNGSTQLIDNNSKNVDEGFISSITTKATAPVSLLVESLVQQLCSLLDSDPMRSQKLYLNICTQLHRMNLIDETYLMNEFDLMRSQYQRALYQLATVARGQTDLPISLQSVWPVVDSAQKSWSRYHREFEELNFIAGGGFGQVFRARHKLDGIEYAVKKITIKYTTIKRVLSHLSEVKTFASLNHTNIVPYKAAWLEPLFNNSGETSGKPNKDSDKRKSNMQNGNLANSTDESSMDEEDEDEEDEDEDDDDGEDPTDEELFPDSFKYHPSNRYNLDDTSSSDFIEFVEFEENLSNAQSNIDANADVEQVICEFNNNIKQNYQDDSSTQNHMLKSQMSFDKSQPHLKLKWATLYIQMALRPLTLRAWLDERNKCDDFDLFYKNFLRKSVLEQSNDAASSDDERSKHFKQSGAKHSASISSLAFEECLAKERDISDVAMDIFSQLLNGLNYIHLQNIVHHDIKPSNVFVGCERSGNLYVQLGDFGLACPLETNHSRDGIIGTLAYAAPEQLSGHCNPKSDLYSLGIILIELLIPFKTDMERVKTIEAARKGNLPNEIPQKFNSILKRLFQHHKKRPDTVDLQRFMKKLTPSVCQGTPEVLTDHDTLKSEDESRATDLERQVHELTIKLNALTKQMSINESLHETTDHELKSCHIECENRQNSVSSLQSDHLFVAESSILEISCETKYVDNTEHSDGPLNPPASPRKCHSEEKIQSSTRADHWDYRKTAHSTDVITSFESDKDKMIALLQSKLLEKSRKESTLKEEITRLKNMLYTRTVSTSDVDTYDELM